MAQQRQVARYLTGRATQGGADTFNQAVIATGIVPDDGLGLEVLGFQVSFGASLAAVSADFALQWYLARDTQAGMIFLNNADCIFCDGWYGSLTTSGQILIPVTKFYQAQEGLFIVESNVYFGLSSTATGIANIADLRIFYREVPLTEVDILRILNNS